jgi:hypothetical protein
MHYLPSLKIQPATLHMQIAITGIADAANNTLVAAGANRLRMQ